MKQGKMSQISVFAIISLLVMGWPGKAHCQSQIELVQLETVDYEALPSGGNVDRPSIAVRDDGLVRIAISDFQSCCPVIVPLKVATREATGDWSYLTITDRGDHPVPHFLASGELGILFMDFGDAFTIKFARTDGMSVQIEPVFQLGLSPSGFVRLAPWEIENIDDIQAVVVEGDLRLRRLAGVWDSADLSAPHDVAIGPSGHVLILTNQGLLTFESPELGEPGVLTPVVGGVPSGGNLIIDGMGQIHIAYLSEGDILYGLLESDVWNIETVAEGIGAMLNDQSLLVDAAGQPYVIYKSSDERIVLASKTVMGWVEVVDLGLGDHGTIVLGPSDEIHASFTAASDMLVRYARIRIPIFSDGFESGDVSAWSTSVPR